MRGLVFNSALLGWLLVCTNGCRTEAPEKPTDAQNSALLSLSARINNVHALLAEQEARALRAKREAEFYECKARNERFTAEAAELNATCLNKQAEQARCAAQVEREKGDSTLIGCITGLGLAALSGGSATPWALGGCATGRAAGELGARECPFPACAAEYAQRSPLSLPFSTERVFRRFPFVVGAWASASRIVLSFSPADSKSSDAGILAAAGLSKGDFLAYLNQVRVPTKEALDQMLSERRGSEIELRYVRGQRLYVGKIVLPRTANITVDVVPAAVITPLLRHSRNNGVARQSA